MENEGKKFKVIVVRLEPQLAEMLEGIKDMFGFTTSGATQQAIREMHRRMLPDYVTNRIKTASKTPEDRADEQIKIKEAKKQREEQEFLDIVNLLEGRISLNEAGRKQVEFYNYDKGNRYFQKLPLHMMNEELVRDQYYPSREAVEKRQAEGKVNYVVGSWE